MNTNDIQELFEGTLSDEQMAEALHVLSVSPERRTAFRQHMALRDAIEKDRLTNGLRPDEDAAIWGAIAGGSGIVTNPGARPFLSGWMRRGIALVTAGVVGYILGSTEFGNLFGGDEIAGNQQAGSVESVSNIAVAPATSTAPQPTGNVASTPNSSITTTVPPIATSAPQVIYRDRIIRVPVLVGSSDMNVNASMSSLANGDRNGVTKNSEQQENKSTAKNTTENNNSEKSTKDTPVNAQQPNAATPSLAADIRSQQSNPPVAPLNNGNGAASTNPSKPENAEKVNNNSGKGVAPVATAPNTDPTRANGFELVYSERLGVLAPTPQGITNPDREFSNRSIGAMYRFGDGQFGFGGRMVYGTLASVTLQKVGENITGGNDYGPVLNADKKLWVEAVGNYRIPLSEKMALNFEGSFGTNSTSTLYGADAFVVWYFTNSIGAQLGAGVASYSYDLREERRKLIEGSLNDGVVSTASDTYRGTLIQGRYGLFFRF